MQNYAGGSKLCGKVQKRLVVRICVGNGLKCEYVREMAKSAIPHPPHLNVASGFKLVPIQGVPIKTHTYHNFMHSVRMVM